MTEPVHSKLGASSDERWMNCAGSVALIDGLKLPYSDEEEWQKEGTTAHSIAATALLNDQDAWELIYEPAGVTAEMAEAVQVHVDYCRSKRKANSIILVEHHVRLPQHRLAYGTTDFGAYDPDESLLDVVDYKHGIGIAVDVEWNPQIMYYARGLLEEFPEARRVRLTICQPRAFHPDGPIRTWEISAEALCLWADEVLGPAMYKTETSHQLDAGSWCRFCPAKIVCPMLGALYRAMATASEVPEEMSPMKLGMEFNQIEAVKFRVKAIEKAVMGTLNRGIEVPYTKLVRQKANRVWKDGAQPLAELNYGSKAFTTPELKSPAAMEEVDIPGVKDWVHEWAYTPPSGVTVARADDKRAAVKLQPTNETFSGVVIPTE